MPMRAHIIDVGFGTMVLIVLPKGTVFFYDCNITDDNEEAVLSYVRRVIGRGHSINVFINSHRDADHMRGIKLLHSSHPIKAIWDTGVPGTTTDSPEYSAYLSLLRSVPTKTIAPRKYWTYGDVRVRCMNAAWEDYDEPNEQSAVMKFEYKGSSLMLAGDTCFRPWKEKILPFYTDGDVKCSLLLAPHHGSLTFLDDPSDTSNYYVEHMEKLKPDMTLISVGPNVHDLPDQKAVELFSQYSKGSNKGNKVYTTEEQGNIKVVLTDDGSWTISINQ
jgi:competence protein ComEC